jgi:hypothetical protein
MAFRGSYEMCVVATITRAIMSISPTVTGLTGASRGWHPTAPCGPARAGARSPLRRGRTPGVRRPDRRWVCQSLPRLTQKFANLIDIAQLLSAHTCRATQARVNHLIYPIMAAVVIVILGMVIYFATDPESRIILGPL